MTDVLHLQPFAVSGKEFAQKIGVDPVHGLSHAEAKKRFEEYGPNQLQKSGGVSPWTILFEQLKNILLLILIGATLLSAILGHEVEAIAIAVIVIFAVMLGFIQEFRAQKSIEALRAMASPTATVVREGERLELAAKDLVPGDVVLLSAGDKVPADLRLLESHDLTTDEATLTGESLPVEKITEVLGGDTPLAERRNMAYAGTSVSTGRGFAVVSATGMQTEFGKIATMLAEVKEPPTPLQQNLDKMGSTLAKAALLLVVIVAGIGVFRGEELVTMLLFAIALAVAVVPEALPAVVTISLAIGVQRMVRRHALIRRLPAVETLGCTSVICSDKTGTLTKDEMTARVILTAEQLYGLSGAGYAPEGDLTVDGKKVDWTPQIKDLLKAAAQCCDARIVKGDEGWEVQGDPTEGALIVAAEKAGLHIQELERESPRVDEIPFSSERKRMTTVHTMGGGTLAYSKGAPEMVIASCSHELTKNGVQPLTPERKKVLEARMAELAAKALRLIGVAAKQGATKANAEDGMTLLGIVGMIDPPRAEAKEAIDTCKKAGIKVIMITGDNPLTAKAIATELGLIDGGKVITGMELDAIDEETFTREVQNIDVYARVSPAHKLRVVSALQKLGHVVAMTGDGVNDAPALKKADIGVAMGITGTDVTKEAGAMTLTDDNFSSIVAAVEEGRIIFGNIKKYLMYLLSSNIGEILIVGGSTLLGLPLPLTAVQLLTINLATDGLPALALAVDPPTHNVMTEKPRNAQTGIFSKSVVALMLTGSIWSALINLGFFWWMLSSGHSLGQAMTTTFLTLNFLEFAKAYAFRSGKDSIIRKPFGNRWLNLSVAVELLLLILIITVPFFHRVFQLSTIGMKEWLIAILLASSVIPVLEVVKWRLRTRS